MRNACKDVTSDKTDTNWALFGYEGQTNVLTLMSTGEDGLEELVDDFNPSKIQYAFLKIEDPNTSLPKFVLVNWQGETAPGTRKGACVRHLADIEKFLAGHHITVTVRNEDELNIEEIIEKVSKCTVSQFNFKEKPQGMDHSPKPVGTAHKKINPLQELPALGLREKFWEKDQSDEKLRIKDEKERKDKDQKVVDEDRRKREEKEVKKRDELIKERDNRINDQRAQEDLVNKGKGDQEREVWDRQREDDARDAAERSGRSEEMRKQRNKEAQQLVGQRSSDSKKVFQRNSSQGQMNFPASPGIISSPPEFTTKPIVTAHTDDSITNDIAPPPAAFNTSPTNGVKIEDGEHHNVIHSKEIPHDIAKQENLNHASHEEGTHHAPHEEETHHAPPFEEIQQETTTVDNIHHASPATVSPNPPISPGDEEVATDPPTNLESYGICAVALYDYQASDETEISFDPGQIISHIDQIDPGWWQGLGPSGNYGLFPANYVDIIDNQELQIM